MEKNVGGLDRLFRIGVGFLSLAIAYVLENSLLQAVFGLVALIGLGTAVMGYCPLNKMFGLNTTSQKKR